MGLRTALINTPFLAKRLKYYRINITIVEREIRMRDEELTNPVVQAAVTAMRDGNREAFFATFAPSAELTDDGHPQPLAE